MSNVRKSGAALGAALYLIAFGESLIADVWVFEPSLTLDQRIDDNYFLIPAGEDTSLSATRLLGELGLNRESENYAIRGVASVDGLLTTNTEVGDEDLDSNQIAFIDASRRSPRSQYGVELSFKNDTPSRDIAADVSDISAIAQDTGLVETQSLSSNVARQEIAIEPRYQYNLTRRLEFDLDSSFKDVQHDLPSAQDAIYQRYLDTLPRDDDGSLLEDPLPFDAVTIADVGVFSPAGELDDFQEAELNLGLRYDLNPVSTLTGSVGYSYFVSQVLLAPEVFLNEFQVIPDAEERQIVRRPRRDQISTTTTFTLGYERFLTPTLQFTMEGGVYTNSTDNSDTFRTDDVLAEGAIAPIVGKSESDGWLASTSLSYDAGLTRYSARFAVDVLPSSAGSQVETNELTGEMLRTLSPRLKLSLRGRAYEPDRLGANVTDRFARRFISFEPRIQWQYNRNWTVAAAYRYRRQKARVDPVSAESNAILFAIKYTAPSKVRDAAQASGL